MLFESGDDWLDGYKRVYRNTFPRQTTRYVNWEVHLAHPAPDQRKDFSIKAVYFRPDGSVMRDRTRKTYAEEGRWTSSHSSWGAGWATSGKWPIGAYRVDFLVEDKLIASKEFEIVDRPTLTTGSFQDLRDRLPWTSGLLPSSKESDLSALSAIMERDPALASAIASLPWVQDGLTGDNRGALQLLDVLSEVDLDLGKQLTGVSWLSDDVTTDEQRALRAITLLAEIDVSSAESLAALSWLQDDVTGDERSAAYGLYQIGRQDTRRLETLLDSRWVREKITENAKWTIQNVRDIGREDPPLAQRLTGFRWLADDLSEDERWAVRYMRDIAREDLAMARRLLDLPGFADDLTESERWAIRYIRDITREDAQMGGILLGFPWLGDGITNDERWGLRYLREIAREDLPLANRLANSPFLQDPFRSRDRHAIRSIDYLQDKYPDLLAEMVKQEWFTDGLSDDEAALVLVFGRKSSLIAPTDLRPFLTDNRLESRPVTFPLHGEIMATDIQTGQGKGRQDISSLIEKSAMEVESFMDIPFPTDDLILLFAGCEGLAYSEDCNFWGLHRGTHIAVDPRLAIKDARGTLIHEVAHYYWNGRSSGVPVWFTEGGADFLEAWVESQLFGEALHSRMQRLEQRGIGFCQRKGIDSVQDIVDKLAELGWKKLKEYEFSGCNYYYGEMLFLQLYEAIGETAFRAAWKDIYETGQFLEHRDMTEEEIYQVFLKHAPPDKLNAFNEVYRKWHGGDFIK